MNLCLVSDVCKHRELGVGAHTHELQEQTPRREVLLAQDNLQSFSCFAKCVGVGHESQVPRYLEAAQMGSNLLLCPEHLGQMVQSVLKGMIRSHSVKPQWVFD